MMQPRHDRIIHLDRLCSCSGSETLDSVLFLPPDCDPLRHVWLCSPDNQPIIQINDTLLAPEEICADTYRWIDYGTHNIPLGFSQLRFRDMGSKLHPDSFLLITKKLSDSFIGCSLEESERKLWGLARSDAGSTKISPSKAPVGFRNQFKVRYNAGPKGLPAGAIVRFVIPKTFSRPQVVHQDQPGFISITEKAANVSILRIEDSTESHQKVDVLCHLDEPLEAFKGFELSYKTANTYIFPNRFHETEEYFWYSLLPPLAAAVAINEKSPLVNTAKGNGHEVEFVAGPAERLHLFLPSRQKKNENLLLRGTFTDRFQNIPSSGAHNSDIELFLEHNGLRTPLTVSQENFTAPNRFEVPLPKLVPGIYRALAHHNSHSPDKTVTYSNPMEIMKKSDSRLDIFFGEIHGHTQMSDGCGEYNELYRHAYEEGCLDFAAAADHACYFSDNQWLWMQDVTNHWNADGRFTTLIGYEWAGIQTHRNIYTSHDRLDLFRGMFPPAENIDVVWRHFHDNKAIVGGMHATMAHGLKWEFHDPTVERFIEIYSMWGASDSWHDNPLATLRAQKMIEGLVSAFELLQKGAKLGFTGGGDCHEGHVGFASEEPLAQGKLPHGLHSVTVYRCGLTGVVMEKLNRKNLIDAIRNRHTYATTGARILLDFSVSGINMGDVGSAGQANCTAEIHGTNLIECIEIIKNGIVAHVEKFPKKSMHLKIQWLDPDRTDHDCWYCFRVTQTDGHRAWSSPVWVMPKK